MKGQSKRSRKRVKKQQIRDAVETGGASENINNYDPIDYASLLSGVSAEDMRSLSLKYAVQRTPDMRSAAKSIAMDSAAMDSVSGAMTPASDIRYMNPQILTFYSVSGAFIGWHACAIIAQNRYISRGCSVKAADGVRNWYELQGETGEKLRDSDAAAIRRADKKYELRANAVQAVTKKNVFGIRHVLFRHTDPDFDYSTEFDPDDFRDGGYAGMVQIDPYWLIPEIDADSMLRADLPNFYNPEIWSYQGTQYHRSHFCILRGDEPSDYLKPTYRYGGIPLTQQVYERLYAAQRTANEAPALVATKRQNWQKMDLNQAVSKKSSFDDRMRLQSEIRNNHGTLFIGTKDEIGQLETNLSNLDEVISGQFQLVAAEMGIPQIKLMMSQPKGFTSGGGEIEIYNGEVESTQSNELQTVIEAHYDRLLPSLNIDTGVEVVWNPVTVLSAKEKAEIRQINSNADYQWFMSGAVDSQDVRSRLETDPDSGFEGISSTDEFDDE